MTQYLLSVWHGELDTPPEDMEGVFAAVDKFNAKVMESGAWVFGGGLEMPDTATVVDASKDDVTMTDGPFSESKEQIGGFWIVELPDLDAALAMAKEASAACRGAVEVRPFQAES
jgi:hypothetical protein